MPVFNLATQTKMAIQAAGYGLYEVECITDSNLETHMEFTEFLRVAERDITYGSQPLVNKDLVVRMTDGSRFIRDASMFEGKVLELWVHVPNTLKSDLVDLPHPVIFVGK